MRSIALLTLTLLATAACRRRVTHDTPPAPSAAATATPSAIDSSKVNPAKLLTSEEIQSVTGEPLKEPITSNRSEAGFIVSQCYFLVTTPSNSVVLTVTRRGPGSDARDPRGFWIEKFHPDQENGEESEAGEEPHTPPEPVAGVGDEAFWVESGSNGALYAMRGNVLVRIAMGGNDEKATRVEKLKKLAQHALERLH
jgi:hypothetical protein